MKKIQIITFLFAVVVALSFAQVCVADDILNDASVIQLQKLNLGDDVVIQKIKSSKCNFDTSIAGLTLLKSAGVSSAVIAAVVTAPVTPLPAAAPSAPAPAPTGNPNDPATPHAPGIWVLVGTTNNQSTLIPLVTETPSEISHGGYIGPFGIGKIAMTARLSGVNAPTELTQSKPDFYLYFNNATAEFAGAVAPAEITLAQLKVLGANDKHNPNQRAVDVAEHGAYGSSYGVDRKAVRPFDITPVANGIYKITPRGDLVDGEYALCAGASTAAMTGQYQYFTFGVRTK
jgi:hypothetical protein